MRDNMDIYSVKRIVSYVTYLFYSFTCELRVSCYAVSMVTVEPNARIETTFPWLNSKLLTFLLKWFVARTLTTFV